MPREIRSDIIRRHNEREGRRKEVPSSLGRLESAAGEVKPDGFGAAEYCGFYSRTLRSRLTGVDLRATTFISRSTGSQAKIRANRGEQR